MALALLPEGGMHARELVELAAILSAHGPMLIEGDQRIPAEGIEQYWTVSKIRLDRWACGLKSFARRADRDAHRREAQWLAARGTLEEILTGEVLTRVWTAVLCAHDRQHDTDDAGPVARSVMIGHMEARHRVLTLMVRGAGIDAESAVKLNRLRGRAERWTDLLVGHLAGKYEVDEFAVDPVRAKDFVEDLQHRDGRHVWPLVVASLRAAFQRGLSHESPNADLNAQIAAAILACCPSDLFDSVGLLHSLWMTRMANIAEDTQGMIEELLTLDGRGRRD